MKNLVILALTIVLPMLVQAHEHIYVITNSQTQGTPLSFLNGAGYSTNSSYVFPLTLASNGTYADKYEFGGVTFASFGIFNFNSPAPGTQVRLRLVAVTGPPGGSFGVWDVDGINPDELDSTTLTFSLLVGTTNGTNSILISENNGEPGADPYGHIHGRHYTATTPGLYVVTVQAYDGSSNGTGGDPIHTVSAPLQIYFQAGDLINSVTSAAAQVNLGFAAKLGTDYYVEATTNLSPATNWETIAGPFTGDSHLQTVTDSDVSVPEKFYRLRLKPTP